MGRSTLFLIMLFAFNFVYANQVSIINASGDLSSHGGGLIVESGFVETNYITSDFDNSNLVLERDNDSSVFTLDDNIALQLNTEMHNILMDLEHGKFKNLNAKYGVNNEDLLLSAEAITAKYGGTHYINGFKLTCPYSDDVMGQFSACTMGGEVYVKSLIVEGLSLGTVVGLKVKLKPENKFNFSATANIKGVRKFVYGNGKYTYDLENRKAIIQILGAHSRFTPSSLVYNLTIKALRRAKVKNLSVNSQNRIIFDLSKHSVARD